MSPIPRETERESPARIDDVRDDDHDEYADLWDDDLAKAVTELYELVKDHPDVCECADCRELEFLAFS